jgi:hypothetical protein
MAARICRVTSALVRRAGQLPPPWGAGGGCGPEVLGRRQFTTHGAAVWGQATPVRGFAATADEFTIQTPFLSDQVRKRGQATSVSTSVDVSTKA